LCKIFFTLSEEKKITFDKVKDHGFSNKVEFVYERSDEALKYFKNNSIDYIYIDGDHSYEGAYFDISSYYNILKNNNIFAGHDIQIPGVKNALNDFLKLKNMDINKDLIQTNFPQECSWYFYKNEN
jgi:predicted O-methyltransferase YrrM